MKKWKCTVCSYVWSAEEKPDKCPACGAESEFIIEAEGDAVPEKAEEIREQPPVIEAGTDNTQRKWKCTVCNYLHEGPEPPEKCPVCGADRSFFIEVTNEELSGQTQVDTGQQHQSGEAAAETKDFGLPGRLILNHHLHPITVHTPNGVLPIAVLFLLGGMIFSFGALEIASLFNLIVVLLSLPPVVFTGYVAWQVKYKGAATPVFKIKLFCALTVAVLLTLMICWRLIDSSVPLSGTTASWIYFGLGSAALAAAGIAGHLGGKLVFDK